MSCKALKLATRLMVRLQLESTQSLSRPLVAVQFARGQSASLRQCRSPLMTLGSGAWRQLLRGLEAASMLTTRSSSIMITSQLPVGATRQHKRQLPSATCAGGNQRSAQRVGRCAQALYSVAWRSQLASKWSSWPDCFHYIVCVCCRRLLVKPSGNAT